MKSFKYLYFMILFLLSSNEILAKDPTFTQFYANPIYLNPAFAGSNKCPRFNTNYRNEWPNLSGNYVTYSASYDAYSKSINGGIGFLATFDKQGKGTINTGMIGLIYSYHLQVNRKFSMLFGARAGYYQKTLDRDKLTFGDMIDPRKGFIYQTGDQIGSQSKQFFDASAGVVGYSKLVFFGLAAYHLNIAN